jgi:hypothetical protein
LLRVAEEILHEVICSQDGIGNAALFDPPLSVAIPPREAHGVVFGDLPGQFHDALHAYPLGFSEKVVLVAPLIWRTRRHEEQCVDTFECGGNALGALEVENRSVDPSLPKRGRFGLAVNACPRRHFLWASCVTTCCPTFPLAALIKILLFSFGMLFSFVMVVLFLMCFLRCPKRNESPRYSVAAATDCLSLYGIGLELPAILAVSLMSATILGFSRAATIASRLFHWP